MRQWKQYLATCARGFALMTSGCAARTGPIRGDASVEGDTTSAVGRGQVTTDSQGQRNSGNNQGSSTTGGGGNVSGSVSSSGSGSGNLSGSGTVTQP